MYRYGIPVWLRHGCIKPPCRGGAMSCLYRIRMLQSGFSTRRLNETPVPWRGTGNPTCIYTVLAAIVLRLDA